MSGDRPKGIQGSDEGVAPPREVVEWYERFGGVRIAGAAASGEERLAGDFLAGGLAALREALARTGRDREGAFALLAADGLLTDAVLAGVESNDPEGAFREILAALGREVGHDPRDATIKEGRG